MLLCCSLCTMCCTVPQQQCGTAALDMSASHKRCRAALHTWLARLPSPIKKLSGLMSLWMKDLLWTYSILEICMAQTALLKQWTLTAACCSAHIHCTFVSPAL